MKHVMKKKRLKKLGALMAAVLLCTLLPGTVKLTASADTPVTYYIKHVDDDAGWKFQTGGWSDEAYNRDLYYMQEEIKDGDIVVIDNNGSDEFINLTFTKRLSNLTIVKDSHAVIAAPSIDEFFALAGSSSAITGDVSHAYLYDNAGVTFHSSVNILDIIDTRAELTGTVTVAGTVGHATCKTESGYIYFETYNVAANKFVVEYGSLKTDAAYYNTTPTAEQPADNTSAAAAPAADTSSTAPVADTSAATQQAASSADEYDDVPKTGESSVLFWLLGTAVVCLAGSRALKKA